MTEIELDLVKKRHFISSKNEDKCNELLEELSSIRLDNENLCSLNGLELLGSKTTHLYLQHNCIEDLSPLVTCGLVNLTFVCLSFNQVKTLCDLSSLNCLSLLDLSNNQIASVDPAFLPKSLLILNLKNNPCNEPTNEDICKYLPLLRKINDRELVTMDEEYSEDEDDDSNIWALTSDILLRSQLRLEQFRDQFSNEIEAKTLELFETLNSSEI